MKTKISNILGVGLALLMVFSLAFALMPTKVAAAEGNMQWTVQQLPTTLYNVLAATTDVTEIAVGADGVTMYAIDGTVNLNAANAIYKSVDGGQSWAGLAAIATAPTKPLMNVAVAPDNPSVVAVSSFDAASAADDVVFISTDGGVTWATLPALANSGVATNLRILDLKAGPARGGTIYGRDYLVATADDATALFVAGSLQILGETATWAVADDFALPLTTTGANGDFVACEFSPNFVGDRIVFGIATENATPTTSLYTINVQNYSTAAPTLVRNVTLDNPAGTPVGNIDYSVALTGDAIVIGDIAVPSNYDITPGFERVYASIATDGAVGGGVWRCDSALVTRELGFATTPVRSIAYSGDTSNGTLFAGQYIGAGLATQVWSTVQMTTNLPAWYPAYKPPTGFVAAVAAFSAGAYVRLSPNYAADKMVYVGTTDAGVGNESAFSVSTDAGLTYNQEALIDSVAGNTVVKIDGIAYAPDGTKLYVATDDGAQLSLWETATSPSPFSWKRIYCFTPSAAYTGGVLAINYATWADAPEVYFAVTNPLANQLFASYDGGNIFNTRSAPVIGAGNAINFLSVESSKVLYMAVGAAAAVTNVYKSTNGGSVWSPARPANVGNITSVIAAPGGDVLVGGAGTASISTDGGVTFGELPPGLNGAGAYVVIPDEGYAENHYIYAGDFSATAAGLFRLQVGTDSLWTDLANPTAAALVGIGFSNGALYDMTAAVGADRTLLPHEAVGDMLWGIMSVGAPGAAAWFDVAQNKLYAASAATTLWAYNDYYATAKPTINSPASGAVIPVDPVTGRAQTLPFSWSAVGTGTGLGTDYLFAIFEKDFGFPGAILATTGLTGGVPNLPLPSQPSNAIFGGAALPDINYVFLGGVEYGVMIAAWNEVSTDAIVSQFSDPVFFSVEASSGIINPPHAGPILTSPTPGAQDVDPGAAFSWAPMAGVTEYELVISLDAALTQPVAGTPVILTTSAYGPVTLEYGTDYYYAVRATAPTSSVQSIGAFRTIISPEEVAPPVVVEQPTISPAWIWAVVIIGALLVVAVLVLIMRTRRV